MLILLDATSHNVTCVSLSTPIVDVCDTCEAGCK